MTAILTGLADLAIGYATAWTYIAIHTRHQTARTWLAQQHAQETAIQREATQGIHQIENHLKEAAEQ